MSIQARCSGSWSTWPRGDIYQANLTVPLRGYTAARAEDLFDRALKRGGATYAGLLITPGATLLSFSPELYLRRRGTRIETHPIKGTLPIPPHAGGVSQATEALMTSAKDRAEHIMIVDLERNDLGRLCVPGCITVEPLMQPVEHPLLLHLESRVKGTLRAGVTMNDLFAATFPGGSVTGAPKKRALEILAELEAGPRGIYCGAFGWIDAEGDCDLNLPIRTAVLRPDGEIEFHSGGGIVADSDPAGEWEELLTKARFFEGVLDIRV
jgi:anthranilate/para-aminobenzoate synthase component I